MAGKQVNWTANALSMVSDIYDYLEDQAGSVVASDYIDDLLNFGNALIHAKRNPDVFEEV